MTKGRINELISEIDRYIKANDLSKSERNTLEEIRNIIDENKDVISDGQKTS